MAGGADPVVDGGEHVVIVIGGAGRLGKTFCRALATAGYAVVVADADAVGARHVAEAIRKDGRRAEAQGVDITDAASIDALIAMVLARFDRVDAVVNAAYPRNANYGRRFEEVAYADFCENSNLHLGGYFLVSQRFALCFRARGGGSIVNVSSIYGAMAPRFDVYEGTEMTMPVEYAAIKSAIIHLSRYVAQYFKSDGVRCNVLSPGGIRDGQPRAFLERYDAYAGSKGMLDAADVCGALLFLVSDASRFVTGQNLIVDDGFSL